MAGVFYLPQPWSLGCARGLPIPHLSRLWTSCLETPLLNVLPLWLVRTCKNLPNVLSTWSLNLFGLCAVQKGTTWLHLPSCYQIDKKYWWCCWDFFFFWCLNLFQKKSSFKVRMPLFVGFHLDYLLIKLRLTYRSLDIF